MARTERDVEAYLTALGKNFEVMDDGTYVVRSGESPAIAARIAGPVLVLRVHIGEAPIKDQATQVAVFRRLLELNATELVYGSYGLEVSHIVLVAALELANLDLNELEAVLADMDLALARHVPELHDLCKA